MAKNGYLNLVILALALVFGITACAGGNRSNLKRIKYNKEPELRQNWKDYITYKRYRDSRSWQRGVIAFVYKLKNDKKIILDNQWIAVTSQEMKTKAKLFSATNSAEIRGQNEDLYGYLVYRSDDRIFVKIIDENTVKLSYHYRQTYSR